VIVPPQDYKAAKARALGKLAKKVATTSPQYKTAVKVLDDFVGEITE
jgi:hypothetical protein